MKKQKLTREQWLLAVADGMRPMFAANGFKKLPKFRVTIGWPSRSALSAKKRTIGECWSPKASADGTVEIIISIGLDEPTRLAGVLAHEMVHAAVGNEARHGAPFKALATAIGLEGKMTATTEGKKFLDAVRPILKSAGKYPGAKIVSTEEKKKQGTRMIKIECSGCGYVVRTTAKWIEVGMPTCCCGNDMEVAEK